MTQRTKRIDEQLRQEIGAILAREIADPRIGFATVTDVETVPDLSHAKVWVSLIGQPDERRATARALAHALPFIRRQIELVDPDVLVTLGNPSTQALLGTREGIMRSRGKWFRLVRKSAFPEKGHAALWPWTQRVARRGQERCYHGRRQVRDIWRLEVPINVGN